MKRRLGIAAAVAVLGIAIALWASRGSTPASIDPAVQATPSRAPVVVAAVQPVRGHRAAPADVTPYPELGTDGITTDDPVTAYRKANIYPPGSRPLTREHVDLLKPNQRHETFRPTDADDGITFRFTADKFFVFADDTIVSTLEVNGAPSVTITAALVAPTGGTPTPVAYTHEAGMLVARLQPATLGLRGQTEIGMFVDFDTGNGHHQRAHYNFQYTPAAGVPARFTGTFHDAVVAGSLVVRADLDVVAAGHYVIDCNLYDATDAPVAWTHYKGDLVAGRQTVELVFFGKVLTDAGARGPFHIGQLRGAHFVPGRDPDLEQIPPFTGTYATQAYAPDDFSSAEYDSADKQKMLRFLEDQAARGVHRGGAR